MKLRPLPLGAPLLAALATGLVLWLLSPGRPGIWAAAELPRSHPGQTVAAIWNGDALNPIPLEPMAVAVLQTGDLLVADVGLAQVHRFGPDYKLRASYRAADKLRYPTGLAVAEDGRVWVADPWQQRIYQLDLLADDADEMPPGPSGYQTPGGLFYRDGLLYVTDLTRHQVLVVRPDGALVRVIGAGRGQAPGQFAYPNAVWVGIDGEVFVSDSNNGRIQVFDSEGRLSRVLQPHRLQLPRGLVQDRRGLLHVVDTMSHDIVVLDPAGHIVARRGESDDLAFPNGLAVRGDRLFVADRANSRVIALEL